MRGMRETLPAAPGNTRRLMGALYCQALKKFHEMELAHGFQIPGSDGIDEYFEPYRKKKKLPKSVNLPVVYTHIGNFLGAIEVYKDLAYAENQSRMEANNNPHHHHQQQQHQGEGK